MKRTRITRRTFLHASATAGGCVAATGFTPNPGPARTLGWNLQDSGPSVTRLLARYVVQSQPATIPEPVVRQAARTLLNWIGCAVGGSNHETVDCALAALTEFSGPRLATVLGRKERLDAPHAALINGISSHVLDFDDTQLKTIIHPAGPVLPAILALAERHPVTGVDFLHAFILGVEVECRIGKAVYPAHYDAGYHITGTAGIFGAAAASGKLLGLSEQQMIWALGTAATQAAGLREMFGSMCKSLHVGRAAQNGLEAALLAARNFTSSDRGIEAARGFAYVLSPARNLAVIGEGLGENFEILENTFKPFACGIVVHPVIDGCIQLRNQYHLEPVQIDRISLRVHPLVLELTGKKSPGTGLEGKFSVYHSAAVAIIRGAAGLKEYSDEVVRDSTVVALRDRVSVAIDPNVNEEEAYVTIRLKDGRDLGKHVEHAIGSLENPMGDADLEAKFRSLSEGILSPAQRDNLMRLCWAITTLKDASVIARASVGRA